MPALAIGKVVPRVNRRKWLVAALVVLLLAVAVTYYPGFTEAEDAVEIVMPAGYRIVPVLTGLTFPTAVAWDRDGRMYVAESGYPYGAKGQAPGVGTGRVLRAEGGKTTVVAGGLNAPVTDVKFKDGEMYVAHRGTLSVFRDGKRVDLIQNLPWGDHSTGEIAFDEEGWVYLGNGTVTNSGVVGEDNFAAGWTARNPGAHDIPARDITLVGQNFTSPDPRTRHPRDTAVTGAFVPFGVPSHEGQTVPGSPEASGVILRVRPDGSDLQVYAWGLRNPFGMRFDPSGRLIAVDQGYEPRGSRPVANAPDAVYHVKPGCWYGWPDYVAGKPITDPAFRARATGGPPLSFLLRDHPPVEQPLLTLPPHTAALRFDFAPSGFDRSRRMFMAAFGPTRPQKGEPAPERGILAVDLRSGKVEMFARNKTGRPAGKSLRGFNRPTDLEFGPDGTLYVVDFGVFEWRGQAPRGVPGTGVVWQIFRQRSEYHEFVSAAMAKVDAARRVGWNPDYGPLEARLREYLSTRPEKWGLYFKDLASEKAFGVNEYVQIPAASTVKVPVVLYATHLVVQGKLSWDEQLTYYGERDWRGGAGTLQFTARDGDSFTIRELAEKAIRDSDNIAWKMLERRLGKQNIVNFMWSLGGENVYPGGQNISTPKDNATYMEAALNFARQNRAGEKLIYDLAHTVWNTGLNRYINEVPVAHKEGDITGVADDVGIVFADFPYVLSIMSEGHADVEAGFEQIGQISRLIYDYQVSLYQGRSVQAPPAAPRPLTRR